jgi:hypothetical protein
MVWQNPWRIQVEKAYARKELADYVYYEIREFAYFQGYHKPSKGFYTYSLRLDIPQWFPEEEPNLYVLSPTVLWKFGGGTINALGASFDFHTLSNGPGGCVKICHDPNWDASKTCVGVLLKGIIWLECYSEHLISGKTISEILYEWKRRVK